MKNDETSRIMCISITTLSLSFVSINFKNKTQNENDNSHIKYNAPTQRLTHRTHGPDRKGQQPRHYGGHHATRNMAHR